MKGKSVLVSGASSGIGFAIAKRFAEEGANIFFTYKSNESGANMLINQITENGGFCVGIKTDHSVFSNAKDVYDKVKSYGKSIDVLINNAGISKFELANSITEESWNEIWNTNVTSMVALTKFFLPDFINKKSGHIINISSVWGQRGSSMETAYSTTKGAVDAYTKALAKELAPSGISVNAISCGYIDTKMNSHLSTEDVESIIEEIPAGRVGTSSDVAELALNITKTNSYMTGQIIGLDGGWQV